MSKFLGAKFPERKNYFLRGGGCGVWSPEASSFHLQFDERLVFAWEGVDDDDVVDEDAWDACEHGHDDDVTVYVPSSGTVDDIVSIA